MSLIFQLISTAIVSFVCMTMGIMFTWPSSVLTLFSSENTTLNRVMTETEISLLGSLSSISGIVVIPFCGYLLDTLGRKWSCVLFYLAQVACWVTIVISNKVEAVLAAMFLSGLSGCMFLVVPIYVSEFCQESIRGSMTSGSMIFYGIGMLVSYLMGGLMEYKIMNYVGLTLTILGLVMFCMMKDSPVFLMKTGREKEAAKAISFYRGMKANSKEVYQEMENIRRILAPDADETPMEEKKLNMDEVDVPQPKLSKWQYLKKSRSTRQALFVCLVLYTACIFQGLVVVQVYAGPLFEQAVPTMAPIVSSSVFAIITIVAGFLGAYLVDLWGRRPLMIYASYATGVCSLVFGTQIHLNWGPAWLTAVFMYLYCISYTVGAATVPFVVVAEVFMPEIKSLTSMLCVEWAFICNFVVLFVFNPLVSTLGLGPVFYIFACCCFISGIFTYFYLPETKGLPVDVIQQKFRRSKH